MGTDDTHSAMLGGHSTLNTVVVGEGMSKYQIPPHFGHHSSIGGLVRALADCRASHMQCDYARATLLEKNTR